MVEGLPANAVGHRFNPWCRRIPHAEEQLGPCATTTEPDFFFPDLVNLVEEVDRLRLFSQVVRQKYVSKKNYDSVKDLRGH